MYAYLSAMQEHGVFDDCQSESRSAHLSAASLVHAIEPLEDARQMLGRHAHTVVAEREVPLVAHLLGREVYRRSVAGIGNGVVGEVTEHAVEQALVAFHHQMLRQLVHERHVLGFEL